MALARFCNFHLIIILIKVKLFTLQIQLEDNSDEHINTNTCVLSYNGAFGRFI